MEEQPRIPTPEYYTADEVAKKLNLHPRTVRRMLNTGDLPGVRFGSRQWRIPHAMFEDYVRREIHGRKPPASETSPKEGDRLSGAGD